MTFLPCGVQGFGDPGNETPYANAVLFRSLAVVDEQLRGVEPLCIFCIADMPWMQPIINQFAVDHVDQVFLYPTQYSRHALPGSDIPGFKVVLERFVVFFFHSNGLVKYVKFKENILPDDQEICVPLSIAIGYNWVEIR